MNVIFVRSWRSMKKAVIEMGTNSTRLLIADLDGDNFEEIEKKLITTRLGAGVDTNKLLSDKAIKRGLDGLKKLKESVQKENVKEVKLIGTSALRDVGNSDTFKKMIKDEIGYNLEVISGEKEADLIFKGVTLDFNFNNYIIIDIGGGSTEFIWQNFKDDEINMKSIDIGAVRITDRFINDVNIPLSRSKVEKISTHIRKTLKENIEISSDINNLIGVGGTITTLASIMLKLESYNSKAIHNYILKYSDINKIMNILRKLDLKMKKKIKGLDPDRADIIVPGTIILIETMKYLRKLKLRVSDYDILHGMLID